MTALSLADRLRVYAATSTDGKVHWSMDLSTACDLIKIFEAFDAIAEGHIRREFVRFAEHERLMNDCMDIMRGCTHLAACLAFWGIIA